MKYLINGQLYNPIKCGDVGDWYNEDVGTEHEPEISCGDCGCKIGEQHLTMCDIERCPCCGYQLISCNCGCIYEVDENISNEKLKKLVEKQKNENRLLTIKLNELLNKNSENKDKDKFEM